MSEVNPERLPSEDVIRDNTSKVTGDQYHNINGETDLREATMDKVASQEGFFTTTARAFKSGANIGYNIYNDLERMYEAGPRDPEWDTNREQWYKEQGERIPANQKWRFDRTGNKVEADLLLSDMETMQREQQWIERVGGIQAFTAQALAGIVDIDAPAAIFGGALSGTAKIGLNMTRVGRLLGGTAAGAVLGAGMGAADYMANPTADWTVIPAMGLAGMAFGTVGGALSRAPEIRANAAVQDTLNEFGETVADGMPLASRDPTAPVMPPASTLDDVLPSPSVTDSALPADAATDAPTRGPRSFTAPSRAPDADPALAKQEAELDALAAKEGPPDTEGWVDPNAGSVGANRVAGTASNSGPGLGSINSTRIQNRIRDARNYISQNDIDYTWETDIGRLDNGVSRAARRFHDAITASGIVSDFGRMFRSGSAVAKKTAFDLLEDPSGIIRNNRSAAGLMEHYHKELMGRFAPVNDEFNAWARAKGHNWMQINTNSDIRRMFDREVVFELQARQYDDPSIIRSIDPRVKAAADHIDSATARDIELGQGRPGELPVKGYENLQKQSGYMPQRWSGEKMRALMRNGKSKKGITESIALSYKKMHPAMTMDQARVYASAVVDRALRNEDGASSNLITLLKDADSRRMVEEMFERNGMNKADIDDLLDRLTGRMETRGSPAHTKQRLSVDLRDTGVDGINLVDLVESDLNKLFSRRLRQGAGQAAMARKGIQSKADWDEIVEAILQEQGARGPSVSNATSFADKAEDFIRKDRHLTKEDLDGIHSYFNGRPVGGGISPAYSRIMKITRLATLNGLGLTQMAETATTIGAVGVKKYMSMLGKELRDSLQKADSPLVQELKHMNIFVPEERLFRDDLVHEFEKGMVENEYLRGLDNMLNKAQRLQGYTSGFYAVRKLQQRIAVTAGADRIMVGLRDGTISPERLYDAGMTASEVSRFKKYITNGAVEFEGNNLKKLNLSSWTPDDAEDFALVMNRVVNQDVQKAMAGEGAAIFHRDGLAALFWQLKAFPMLALEKQAYRNMRIMDQQAAATFLYGLGTAAAVFSARQTISGNTQNLTAEKIARGAFGMSNITGWIPMWVDPIAGMLGMDDMKLSGYGRYSGPSVLSTPASFSVMDRLLQLPGTVVNAATGNLSNSDIRTLQALPIIGNAYGFTLMFNAMKD